MKIKSAELQHSQLCLLKDLLSTVELVRKTSHYLLGILPYKENLAARGSKIYSK